MRDELSLRLSAGTVRYTDSGRGPVIVFVHGVFVNGLLWRKLLPRLEKSFRCIVPTWPLGAHEIAMSAGADLTALGHARLIAEFLDALDLHDVTLVGNDTGGALCQLVIAHHPERVGRVVLTNCDSFENFPPPILRPLYAAARIPGFFGLVAQLLRLPLLQRVFFRTVARTVPERDLLESLFRPLRTNAGVRRDLAALMGSISSRELLEAAPKLASFSGTALVAWGENDFFFPTNDGRRLAEAFDRASLVPIAGSRTFVPEDQPIVLAESIERFIGAAVAA